MHDFSLPSLSGTNLCYKMRQDSVTITVRNAWGIPTSAGSVSVETSAVDSSSKGKAVSGGPQTLQQGSSSGEYLYSSVDLHAQPGIYK